MPLQSVCKVRPELPVWKAFTVISTPETELKQHLSVKTGIVNFIKSTDDLPLRSKKLKS